MRHVNPDLMGSAGFQPQTDKGKAVDGPDDLIQYSVSLLFCYSYPSLFAFFGL